jgi:DNA-binding XRE family transcriptional regulator
MLEICGVDLDTPRASSQRTGLKNRLLGALDTLSDVYGVGVHAEDVGVKYIKWEDWTNRVAYFDPPDTIRGRLFGGEAPAPKALPGPGGDWTGAQIRALRKRLGVTQKDLAALLDVRRAYVSMLENHKRNPSRRIRKTLDKIAARGR